MNLAPRACAQPGCPRTVTGRARCSDHERAQDQARGSAADRGYGYRWRQRRARWLRHNPLCVNPWGHHGDVVAASVVDHWVAKNSGGVDEVRNYASMCEPCHNHKRALESRGVVQRAGDRPRPLCDCESCTGCSV